MKKNKLFKSLIPILLIAVLFIYACNKTSSDEEVLRFAFFTDIHLNGGDNGCFEGLDMAINSAKDKGAKFIITGGDNVDIDGFKSDTGSARGLYEKYRDVLAGSPLKVYPTIGNHDRFWGIVSEKKPHGETLFEEYLGPSYYSFEQNGWKFIILNTVQVVDGKYMIDSTQRDWIKNELANTNTETPLILSMHVPMMSVYYASARGQFGQDMFYNFGEVKDMFNEYNLKLVLQGHQHLYEEIKTRGVQYITGGAVSASWWGGPYYDTEEGYLLVSISGDDFSWEYIDYGWTEKSDD